MKATFELKSGDTIVREYTHPRGHSLNPLTDDELDEKYEICIRERPADQQRLLGGVRKSLWEFDTLTDVAGPLAELSAFDAD